MATTKKRKDQGEQQIEVQEIHLVESVFCVLIFNFIMHRFPFKAWQELILPSVRGNRASLEQKLKHDPFAEYRSAFYLNRDNKRPALFHVPNGAFHGALASAAIDTAGAKKAQIERLTKVVDLNIDLYGIPQIFCSMVRNSDMNHTPDVRTRPIFPVAACKVTVRYLKNLTERSVTNLFAAAGVFIGIGDWRSEKGGPYGSFKIVGERDKEFQSIIKTQGRTAQQKAFDKPAFFDSDTTDILRWFEEEVRRREMEGLLADSDKKRVVKLPKGRRVIVERGGTNGKAEPEYVGIESAADKLADESKAA